MPQPTQPEVPPAAPGDEHATNGERPDRPAHRDRQDTLLLSDVPEASALMPEAVPSRPPAPSRPDSPNSDAPKTGAPQFPTLDLSPLSQRYELLAEAGHGSMGNVYKARDRETGETVALKLLKPEIASDQTMMERFKKELLFARKITHKHVCRVHDFNRIGGIAYTSMEYVEGESLRSVLNRFGGLPPRKALDLAAQMCSALQEAHAQGIVHRDLKPENVMIDSQGNAKIMDFGIARSMDAMTRLTGSMVGTPAYMAPEQVAGKPVDFRSDIYSLGLILYEMFTGKPAFEAENAVAVALKQMREAPKPPRSIDASIPFGIERAIMKCLDRDPSRRFQSVSQLADALRSPASSIQAPPAISTSAPAGAVAGAPSHPTNGAPLPHPLYGSSAMSAPEPRRSSASGWILLILVLAGGAYAALRWDRVVNFEHEYAPLTASAAKYYYAQAKSFIRPDARNTPQSAAETAEPNVAQEVPPKTEAQSGTPAAAAPGKTPSSADDVSALSVSKSAEARNSVLKPERPRKAHADAPKSAHAISHPVSPRKRKLVAVVEAKSPVSRTTPASAVPSGSPVKTQSPPATAPMTAANQSPAAPPKAAAAAAQNRAGDASDEPETLSVPPVNDRSPSYLWIGRFESEDRAQVVANKVEGLGLPVVVIPRRRQFGSIFLVLSGPFGPERVGSVMDWLKQQGFRGIRVLKNPLRNGHLVEGVEQDPE